MLTPAAAQQHIRIAALVTLVSGILALVPALFLVLMAAGFATAGAIDAGDGAIPGMFVGGILGLVAIGFAVTAIPSIVAGFGLMARKPWARVLTIILGVINLFFFPIGTIIGAYQLWVLAVNQETRTAYESGTPRPGSYASSH
jgi:hypothetical protein